VFDDRNLVRLLRRKSIFLAVQDEGRGTDEYEGHDALHSCHKDFHHRNSNGGKAARATPQLELARWFLVTVTKSNGLA
jgi:hypothetical protein